MHRPTASEVVAQAATDQTDGLRVSVTYSERKIEGVQLIQVNDNVRTFLDAET